MKKTIKTIFKVYLDTRSGRFYAQVIRVNKDNAITSFTNCSQIEELAKMMYEEIYSGRYGELFEVEVQFPQEAKIYFEKYPIGDYLPVTLMPLDGRTIEKFMSEFKEK